MSAPSLCAGCIIHYERYRFSDGATRNTYLVIVGAKMRCNYLAVVATSVSKRRHFVPGCHAYYYHIPRGADWFPKDTWLLIAAPREFKPAELIKATLVEKVITLKGQLRGAVTNALRNCVHSCPDVNDAQRALL